MTEHRIFKMSFSTIYSLYLTKIERKERTKEEVDEIIYWLTGYSPVDLQNQLENKTDLQTFFAQAPELNPNRHLITGLICGVRVETIDEPLMREIRYLDKLIDELAKGKKIEKILR
ncbi:MAG: DUF2200 domain-containing protein [Enterococcus lacertideformus]|uniref:DUF2200 domain-containing protein n=1 Tax=Enterococcus lacertideformus TaxID=2771493 RepID=A0A931F8Q0_9ENTE|nr:DUF2200 domain-containing protein [Enterococcus lacertideformus]